MVEKMPKVKRAKRFVIRSPAGWEGTLYWCNASYCCGWVTREDATVFTQAERDSGQWPLPEAGAEWVEV